MTFYGDNKEEAGCLALSTQEDVKENFVLSGKQRITGIKLGKEGDRFRSV